MTAFYNEREPYAAQWLRNLIDAGRIAPGIVDERDIRDIRPDDLAGYTQCHFFAGIGVWSHALRRAGWADDQPVWTGSCPCQPFSAAGQRGGVDDERHLWPHFHWLIDQCRPPVVLGEQVASKDGLGWLDLVSADMEASGYAFGASDLCAAGFSGAHIRQRLYFVGIEGLDNPTGSRCLGALGGAEGDSRDEARLCVSGSGSAAFGLADPHHQRPQGRAGVPERADECAAGSGSVVGGLADSEGSGWRKGFSDDGRLRGRGGAQGQAGRSSIHDGLGVSSQRPHAPLLGRDAADWLYCRDGKWRPAEPGTFPLADAAPSRVGRLRAYGNALDAETASNFVSAVMESLDDVADALDLL